MIVGASFSFGSNFTKTTRACARLATNASVPFTTTTSVGSAILVAFFTACICLAFVARVPSPSTPYINNEFVPAHVTARRARFPAATPSRALSYANSPSHGVASSSSVAIVVSVTGDVVSVSALIVRAPRTYAIVDSADGADDACAAGVMNSTVRASTSANGDAICVKFAARATAQSDAMTTPRATRARRGRADARGAM